MGNSRVRADPLPSVAQPSWAHLRSQPARSSIHAVTLDNLIDFYIVLFRVVRPARPCPGPVPGEPLRVLWGSGNPARGTRDHTEQES